MEALEASTDRRGGRERSARASRRAQGSLANLGLALLGVTIGCLLYGQRTLADALDWVDHSLEVRAAIQQTRGLLSEAESGVRGYLLTGSVRQKQLLERAQRELPDTLHTLHALTADNPVQQTALVALDGLARSRVDVLAEIVRLRDAGSRELALSRVSSAEVDRLHAQLDAMDAGEGRLLEVRRSTARVWSMSLTVGGVMSGLALAVIALGYRRVSTFAQRMAEEEHELFEGAPDGIFVADLEGRYTRVNAAGCRMLGYTRDEVVGRFITDFVSPEELARQAELKDRLAHGESDVSEWELKHKDGSYIPTELSSNMLPNGHLRAVVRDISKRRQMEAGTRLLAERLTSAIESTEDAFALFDASQRLVLCNSVYARLIGASLAGPVVGRSFAELLDAWLPNIAFADAQERERFRAQRLQRSEPDQPPSYELRMRDGRTLRIHNRRTPEGGMVATLVDISADVRVAAELREARVAAEAASAAKSEFLSSMSHELRTPLNAILGFAQLLWRDRKEPLSTRQLGRVDQILRGGQHLLRLIDDILDLARIEAGGVALSTEPVDVGAVLEEVRRTLEPLAVRQRVSLTTEVPADLPRVAADRTRFVQILMNLGSNAIKYNRAPGAVTFRVSTSLERVRVTVVDTGFGIPVDKQESLFQPFQRAGQEAGPIQGTGIGLVITQRLARLMGGDVGFRSAPDVGSEFWIDLPVAAAGSCASPLPQPCEQGSERLAHAARRVLYVEDNPANVSFMTDLVGSMENIELFTAATAEAGLALAREQRPDAIIMDINLPGMSGVDALHELRARVSTADIPVIALTAAASPADKQRGAEAGFDRYLTKPVNVDEFVAALDALLAQTGGMPSLSV